MTAPAVAPASGAIAPPVQRASAQAPADAAHAFAHAFTAVLDALPAGASKAGGSTAEDQPHVSKESRGDSSANRQSTRHSLLSDGALLASLPFALSAASAMDAGSQAGSQASSPAPAAAKTSGAGVSGASVATTDKLTAVGRLVGERAFHFGASGSPSAFASRGLTGEAPFTLAGASGEDLAAQTKLSGESAVAAQSSDNAAAAAPIGARAMRTPHANRASPARAAGAHEAVRGEREPEASAAPVARAASSAAAPASADSRGSGADGRLPDPTGSPASSLAQADPFGALISAPFAAASSFEPDGSTAAAAGADAAPRAGALASPAAPGPAVKEIDIDLSPGGLEDVSMTMRLAGDKLSVVIRAGSSQTLSSIEGARDAIADRMAAIGQPLDSLTVRQMGVSTNGNSASAGDGSGAGERRSAQGGGEGGDSNDAWSRRGAGRDRSF
ncbi:MAG TPA: flagellar hook-length control protein FliK [Roseiarcus sp.]|jgi:hypothetical protein